MWHVSSAVQLQKVKVVVSFIFKKRTVKTNKLQTQSVVKSVTTVFFLFWLASCYTCSAQQHKKIFFLATSTLLQVPVPVPSTSLTGTIGILGHILVQSVPSVSLTGLEISYAVTACNGRLISVNTRNSSGDEIANVNFLYDDIVHAVQNTIDSCINSATDRRGYVLEHGFT